MVTLEFRILKYYTYFSLILLQVKLSPILNGYTIEESNCKYPYIVSLQTRISCNRYEHFCAGSLLNSKWILTAAHCVWEKDLKNIYAAIGFTNLRNIPLEKFTELDDVKFLNYQWTSLRNDIALLHMRTTSYKLQPDFYAKIPNSWCNLNSGIIINSCKIVGYGATQNAGSTQNKLHEGQVSLINNWYCHILLGKIWAPELGDNKICALSNYYNTCQGDSGGPLICEYNGINYVYGIISYGLDCDTNGIPSVYTLTAPYWIWINYIINENSFE